MNSCIYRGSVWHRRMEPEHRFHYSTAWFYLDLDEVEQLVKDNWAISHRRFAPNSFQRSDHLGDPDVDLRSAVHDFVQSKTGVSFSGPVRLLTQLRHFGVYFSPVNIYYCFDNDRTLRAMVAEVSNTPWNERHCYVLWDGNRHSDSVHRYSHPKEFHVSPFMGMDSTYQWHINEPSENLVVSLGCLRGGQRIFQAHLRLRRTELTSTQAVATVIRRPVAGAHIVAAIYFQAFRLWWKKCQFYPHPGKVPPGSSLPETAVTSD